MKNTKTLFLISFFGCFVFPLMIVFFAAFAMFFEIEFITDFYNGIMSGGGIGVMAIYQIIIILITLMLALTLKLKNVESITTEEVIKGKKSTTVIKKINTIELKNTLSGKRKAVKVPDKRDIPLSDVESVEIKSIKKSTNTSDINMKTPINTKNVEELKKVSKPKRPISNLKK